MTYSGELFKRYPELFWEPIPVECLQGWYPIINRLCTKLVNGYKEKYPPYGHGHGLKIIDIKEKFGELRVCVSTGWDWDYHLIEEALEESKQTCEICGGEGKIRGKKWYRTRCELHKDEK